MANKQSQNMRRAYQIDEITHGKGGGYSQCIHMRTQGGVWFSLIKSFLNSWI